MTVWNLKAADLSGFPADDMLGVVFVDNFIIAEQRARVRAVLDQFRTKAIRGFQITGSPEQVADEIIAIVDGSGIDGIMLEPTFGGPASYEAFIELVLPILIERGRAGTPEGATLRERLSGSPRLAPTHRAHRLTATDASAEASVTAPLAAAT